MVAMHAGTFAQSSYRPAVLHPEVCHDSRWQDCYFHGAFCMGFFPSVKAAGL